MSAHEAYLYEAIRTPRGKGKPNKSLPGSPTPTSGRSSASATPPGPAAAPRTPLVRRRPASLRDRTDTLSPLGAS
jgi:hypothetical protein